MIALALLAQALSGAIAPPPPPTLRDCAVAFTALGMAFDEQRKKNKDAKAVRRLRDALLARAEAKRDAIESEAAAKLAAAKAATDRASDTEIDVETCTALAGVTP